MLFSLLKHYLDTDTSLKVSQSVYSFTTSISHGVENYVPRLWGTGISDAIFCFLDLQIFLWFFLLSISLHRLELISFSEKPGNKCQSADIMTSLYGVYVRISQFSQ